MPSSNDEAEKARPTPPTSPPGQGLGARLRRALGPVLPGLVIDCVDLLTIGGLGVFAGPLIGGPAGFFLARQGGLRVPASCAIAVASGLYCASPPTTLIPVATTLGIVIRLLQEPQAPADEADGDAPH